MLETTLAQNLKAIRLQNHWNQETAAELCDISERYWGKLERGQAAASVSILEKLSQGLKVSVSDLLKEGAFSPAEEESEAE